MRPVVLLLAAALSLPLACSTKSPAPAASGDDASMTIVNEGGSPADCTNAGGTCVTFQTECPPAQVNTVLCGDSVMICCLPPEDAAPYLGPADAGGSSGGDTGSSMVPEAAPEAGPEAAPEASPVEASSDGAGE
jgi:hypothetical protein